MYAVGLGAGGVAKLSMRQVGRVYTIVGSCHCPAFGLKVEPSLTRASLLLASTAGASPKDPLPRDCLNHQGVHGCMYILIGIDR